MADQHADFVCPHEWDDPTCFCGPLRIAMRREAFERGILVGLERAMRWVMSAPLCQMGQRRVDGPDGFPRMADPAVNEDGDPNLVACNYALRDAILYWIERDMRARIDGRDDV